MKFFERSRVKWNRWQPTDIMFKRNSLVKKLVPSTNYLSYSTKADRDHDMARLTGGTSKHKTTWNGQPYTYYDRDKYRAVHVKLKDLKTPFPTADIDFIDYVMKEDSVGNKFSPIDALVYVGSFHQRTQWSQANNGQWHSVKTGNIAPVREGYRIAYGGQGDSNYMSTQNLEEIAQITNAVLNFLIEVVIPFNNGESIEHHLEHDLMVA